MSGISDDRSTVLFAGVSAMEFLSSTWKSRRLAIAAKVPRNLSCRRGICPHFVHE
jgi:hypothetical protein